MKIIDISEIKEEFTELKELHTALVKKPDGQAVFITQFIIISGEFEGEKMQMQAILDSQYSDKEVKS